MKKFTNQHGMSMVSVMMAAAALGAIALVSAQLVSNSSKSQRGLNDSMTVNDAYNTIQRLLLKSEHCKAILDGVTIPADGTENDLTSIKTYNTDTGGSVTGTKTHYTIGVGKNLPGANVEFTSLVAIREAATPKMVTLEALFTKKSENFGGKTLKKRFYLEASFSANVVSKCFSQMDNAVESACKSLDSNNTLTGADCNLTTALQEEIVANGMGTKKRLMWVNPADGNLKMAQTFHVVEQKGRHDHFCHCRASGISCPAGYSEVRQWCTSGKRQTRCGGSRTSNGYKECRKPQDPIGYYFID